MTNLFTTISSATSRRLRRGLTFLELLIAIVIVVIVVIAILQLFDKDVEVRKQQDQAAELQQNLRAAMDLISRDVRGASSCVTIPSSYKDPADPAFTMPVAVPLPIAAVWMPSEGPLSTNATLCGTGAADSTRPDGIAVMRCVGNGIVNIETPLTVNPGTQIQFTESMGLQDSDVGKFLIFWLPDGPETKDPPVNTPPYFTARIDRIDPPAASRTSIVKELVTIGVSLRPSGVDQTMTVDRSHATFGMHWCPSNSWPTCTATPAFNGEIKNFDRAGTPPLGDGWKCAMVEWVEYIVDKWGDNDVPHAYSDQTQEGSCEHPLLVRRVNPHYDATAGTIVPEWDVVGQDIENMQVVWVWDPDGDPRTSTVEPRTNLEYQAGDPSYDAVFGGGPYSGFPARALLGIDDLWVDPLVPANSSILYPAVPFPSNNGQRGSPTLVALRKVRITLLGRTRDRDTSFGKARNNGSPSSGLGFPGIEVGEQWLQGSASIPGGPPTPPLYLSGYRRRALTSELSLRNYLPGGLE